VHVNVFIVGLAERVDYGVFQPMLETPARTCMLVALGYQDSYPGRLDAGKNLAHQWEVHAVLLDIPAWDCTR
jgi:hypothetical protein